jgi:hypothetical protein
MYSDTKEFKMAKQGQHKHDDNDQNVSKGHNNPTKSQDIVTGSYKKPETYKKQAALHQDPGKQGQHAKAPHIDDTRDTASHEAVSELLEQEPHTRSGSDSDTAAGSRGY